MSEWTKERHAAVRRWTDAFASGASWAALGGALDEIERLQAELEHTRIEWANAHAEVADLRAKLADPPSPPDYDERMAPVVSAWNRATEKRLAAVAMDRCGYTMCHNRSCRDCYGGKDKRLRDEPIIWVDDAEATRHGVADE